MDEEIILSQFINQGNVLDLSSLSIEEMSFESQEKLRKKLIEFIDDFGIREIKLSSGLEKFRDDIIKNACTTNISFDGSEELFEEMRNNPLHVSESMHRKLKMMYSMKKNIEVTDEHVFSEYDLFEFLKDPYFQNLMIYGHQKEDIRNVISVEDLSCIKKYMPDKEFKLTDFCVQIKSVDELKRLEEIEGLSTDDITLFFEIKDLKNIKDLNSLKNYNIQIFTPNMSELDAEQLQEIQSNCNVEDIWIFEVLESRFYKGNYFQGKSVNDYSPDTYLKMRKSIENLVEGIDLELPELDRFIEVYRRLGQIINYDNDDFNGKTNINSHNLQGVLLGNLGVCEGISKTLEQALKLVNIETICVSGSIEAGNHVWNQVNIDGVWYNVDLTMDADNIQTGKDVSHCLKSNQDLGYVYDVKKDFHQCETTYNQEDINEKIGKKCLYVNRPGEKNFFTNNLMEQLGRVADTGEKATIELISLSKIGIDETTMSLKIGSSKSSNSLTISNDELTTIINDYFGSVENLVMEDDGYLTTIHSQGIDLVFTGDLREKFKDLGIDIDEKLAITSPNNSDKMPEIQTVEDKTNNEEIPQQEFEEQKEESIRDEIGDELREETAEGIEDKIGDEIDRENNSVKMHERGNPEVNLWMNRFSNWYNVIDRVSQNTKAKFIKMKSDIINVIRSKLKERTNKRQQNSQKTNSNER